MKERRKKGKRRRKLKKGMEGWRRKKGKRDGKGGKKD